MTRGGVRKGAGRPRKLEADKKTANLCGVRVTPQALDNYRDAARRCNMTLTAWVEMHLERGLDDVVDGLLGRKRGG